MTSNIELDIKNLLDLEGDPATAADQLISMFESSEDGFTTDNFQSVARFLWRAGLPDRLLNLCSRHLFDDRVSIPWDFVFEAVGMAFGTDLPPAVEDSLREALLEADVRALASRSKAFDNQFPTLRAERADRRLDRIKSYRRAKDELIEQLTTLRTQQLYEQEKSLLARLTKLYPDDEDVKREVLEHRQRYALDVLSKHRRVSGPMHFEAEIQDAEMLQIQGCVQDNILMLAFDDSTLARDLAVAAVMLDMVDTALTVLDNAPADEIESRWLRAELLLISRRYLELLQELARLELDFSEDSETFFGTAYLRAQALWGLGQKHTAIEVLESLLAARPHYRSGLSLLSVWRGP